MTYPLVGYWEAQIGVAVIGSSALVALLFMYRRLRSRFFALGVIRDALLALDSGTDMPFVLAAAFMRMFHRRLMSPFFSRRWA